MLTIADRAKNVASSLTLEITAKAKKMQEEGIAVVSFGAGEPDFNTPQYIIEACKKALDEGKTKYTPASGTVSLRKEIALSLKKDYNLDYDFSSIVVSNGAKQALHNAFQAVLNEGDEVILPSPYWLTYPELIKLSQGVVKVLETKPENDFKVTGAELKKAITKKTKAIVLNNPSNPTGTVYSREELKDLANALVGTDIYIIADEIYDKLVYEGEFVSLAQAEPKLMNQVILVNGVSKTYSMTGWRIGYTASNKEVAKAIGNIQSHTTSNPNTMAQYASQAAYASPKGAEFLAEMKTTFDRRRRLITGMLDDMKPLTYIMPKGAFYCFVGIKNLYGKEYKGVKISGAIDIANLLLTHHNVAVIPCESFGEPDYIRLSYAIADKDIERGLNYIKDFLKQI